MNIGYHLAEDFDRKVLLVDLDPQASLTDFMGLEPLDLEKTVYNSLINGEALPVFNDIYGMDLVPSNIELSAAELALVVADMRDFKLKQALSPLQDAYDFILIDCPPSLGILSYISLVASTHVLIPIQTHNKALKGTELLIRTIYRVQNGANRMLKVAGAIPTWYEASTNQGKRSLESIRKMGSKITIYPPIPKVIAFADASELNKPLALYNARLPVVENLRQIAYCLDTLS